MQQQVQIHTHVKSLLHNEDQHTTWADVTSSKEPLSSFCFFYAYHIIFLFEDFPGDTSRCLTVTIDSFTGEYYVLLLCFYAGCVS